MYHDQSAFDEVSRAMRERHAPADRTEVVIIPELIGRLEALFASRAAAPAEPRRRD